MPFTSNYISLKDTGRFSELVLDYIQGQSPLKDIVPAYPEINNIGKQIALKSQQPINRTLLQQVFREQYESIELHPLQHNHISSLTENNTFTICTAHQPNLFSGHLYLIYKIVHAIELAEVCRLNFPEYQFVPVYYIGSEDHDLDEIGSWNWNHHDFRWQTNQSGACGSMLLKDIEPFIQYLEKVTNSNLPEQETMLRLVKEAYQPNHTLSQAIRILINGLFSSKGLLILDANHPALKATFKSHLIAECIEQKSEKVLKGIFDQWQKHYPVQAFLRPINLFYLKPGLRARIEKEGDHWKVLDTDITFTENMLQEEINQFPERFSPNVIMRPLYQEFILPNIAFVGGGAEVAYWLPLKSYFQENEVVMPLVFLRNSFQLIEQELQLKIQTMRLGWNELFESTNSRLNRLVSEQSEFQHFLEIREKLDSTAQMLLPLSESITAPLKESTYAHLTKLKNTLDALELKFKRHLKRKETLHADQWQKIHSSFFPDGHLQERHENFLSWHQKWGDDLLKILHQSSQPFGTMFCLIVDDQHGI